MTNARWVTDAARAGEPRCAAPASPRSTTCTRRRAEYSTDASNYRVVPDRRRVPAATPTRSQAAVAVARQHGVPITARGGGTSIAGNAVGAGHRPGLLAAPEPRPRGRSRGGTAGRRARRDPRQHHRRRRAARPAVRAGPVHARAGHDRRLDRQQRLRVARTALRPHRRQRRSSSTCSPPAASGHARAVGRDGLAAAGRSVPRCTTIVDAHLGAIRTEFGRFRRQVSGYSLEHLLPENGARRREVPRRHRRARSACCSARRCGSSSRRRAVALAVLGYPDMAAAADAVPALLPHAPSRSRAWTLGWSRSCASGAAPAAVPAAAARARLAVRRDVRRHRGRGAPRAEKLIADAGCLDSTIVTGAPAPRAVAHPRGRRRARRPHPGGRAGVAGLGGRRRPAAASRRVPARVRGAARPHRRGRSASTATSARAACTPASTSRSPPTRARFRDVPRRRGRARRPGTAVRCRASTATDARAASCCRTCTRRRRSRPSPRSSRSSTRRTCSTPA